MLVAIAPGVLPVEPKIPWVRYCVSLGLPTCLYFSINNICRYRCVYVLTEDCEYTAIFLHFVTLFTHQIAATRCISILYNIIK